MEYRITGELAQVVELGLSKGEDCWANNGAIVSITSGATWQLRIPGGLGGAVGRSFSGTGVSLTFIQSTDNGQMVRLSSNQPGKIIAWDLSDGPVLTTRGSFVAAFGTDINISVTAARRAGAALFGGAGMFLQKISGQGVALIHGAGDFVDQTLTAKESILVSTGNLAAFASQVDYGIQGVGGCRKMFFGGEGVFMTKLTGPGRVLLQTLKRGVAE